MLMRFHIVIVEYKSGTYANGDGCYGYLTVTWRIPLLHLSPRGLTRSVRWLPPLEIWINNWWVPDRGRVEKFSSQIFRAKNAAIMVMSQFKLKVNNFQMSPVHFLFSFRWYLMDAPINKVGTNVTSAFVCFRLRGRRVGQISCFRLIDRS